MSPRLRDWSDDPDATHTASRSPTVAHLYHEALRALARRELTSRQVNERLTAAGGRAVDVAAVIARLTAQGALDDRRAARIYAQRAFRQRKRPRSRIEAELEALGISRDIVRDTVDDVCSDDVERSRLEHAVIYALRGTRRDQRDDDARRLFAQFQRQGYDPENIRRAFAKAGIETAGTARKIRPRRPFLRTRYKRLAIILRQYDRRRLHTISVEGGDLRPLVEASADSLWTLLALAHARPTARTLLGSWACPSETEADPATPRP